MPIPLLQNSDFLVDLFLALCIINTAKELLFLQLMKRSLSLRDFEDLANVVFSWRYSELTETGAPARCVKLENF